MQGRQVSPGDSDVGETDTCSLYSRLILGDVLDLCPAASFKR